MTYITTLFVPSPYYLPQVDLPTYLPNSLPNPLSDGCMHADPLQMDDIHPIGIHDPTKHSWKEQLDGGLVLLHVESGYASHCMPTLVVRWVPLCHTKFW